MWFLVLVYLFRLFFFFFKQKTAYEMRISDWSSDVCSSDLLPLLRDDDLIWVHDYHLLPFGEMLREAGCRQKLGFFLHIPFPVREIFATLPMHDRLARALMAYDLIGFQTESDVQRFRDYVLREAGGSADGDRLSAYGRTRSEEHTSELQS